MWVPLFIDKSLQAQNKTKECVSKKSTPFTCLKSITTSLALNLSIDPLVLSFFWKIHLQPILLQPEGEIN